MGRLQLQEQYRGVLCDVVLNGLVGDGNDSTDTLYAGSRICDGSWRNNGNASTKTATGRDCAEGTIAKLPLGCLSEYKSRRTSTR